jgi:hypothetical protein
MQELCTRMGIKSSLNSGIRCAPVTGVKNPFLRGMQSSEPSVIVTSTVSSTENVARLKRRHEAIPECPRRLEAPIRKDCNCLSAICAGSNMTTLLREIPFLLDAPVNSVKRTMVAVPVGCVSNLATENSHEEWQSRHLQQWICELLIKNQQLRWALMEMKEMEPRKNEGRNV